MSSAEQSDEIALDCRCLNDSQKKDNLKEGLCEDLQDRYAIVPTAEDPRLVVTSIHFFKRLTSLLGSILF